MIGAILAIKLMKMSRRMTLYATTITSAVAICLQIIENQWLILAGRFILGFAMAFMAVSTGRFLEEFTPMHLFGTVLTMQGFLQNGVTALTMIAASQGMPASNDIEGLKTTEYWRVFVGFPLVFCGVAFALLFFFIKHEPPKFLIQQGKEEEALESIKASYHRDEDPQEILNFLKTATSDQQDTVTPLQAICDRRYCVPTYLLMFFGSLTLLNGAQFFSLYG